MNPFAALPPEARKWIYLSTFALGVLIGAIQTGFDTLDLAYPDWLLVAGKVFPYLVAGFGLTAASNTPDPAAMKKARRALIEEDQP